MKNILQLIGLVVVLYFVFSVWPGHESSPNISHTSVADQTPTVYKVGQDFSVGYWSYRCNGTRWEPMIGTGYTAEIPDAAFLIVDLTIRNDDHSASTFPPLKLVDAQGREYSESSKGIFLPAAFDVLKKLNPGVSSRGYVVFDAPHGNYLLKLSGGFYSGKYALVDLSASNTEHHRPANSAEGSTTSVSVTTTGSVNSHFDMPEAEQHATASTTEPNPVTEDGSVSINSEPEGADIFIDSGGQGRAPAILKLSPGKHSLQLAVSGYKDWTTEIEVTSGATVYVTATLEK